MGFIGDTLRTLQQAFARCRQQHAFRPAVEDFLTDFCFQALDPPKYRRAVNVQHIRRAVQGTVLCCRVKNPQVIPIEHVLQYCTCMCVCREYCCK